ncbi:unnamed protein product [Amoebophrya sp. A25]|nr:unnamed protein product [Amoebophrya sp. A25]|eukprot:GSA25T00013992001.1
MVGFPFIGASIGLEILLLMVVIPEHRRPKDCYTFADTVISLLMGLLSLLVSKIAFVSYVPMCYTFVYNLIHGTGHDHKDFALAGDHVLGGLSNDENNASSTGGPGVTSSPPSPSLTSVGAASTSFFAADASSALSWSFANDFLGFNEANSVPAFWLALLAADLWYYLVHRWCHVSSWMWTVHAVHHSTEEFNITAGPREGFLYWVTPYFLAVNLPLAVFFPPQIALAAVSIISIWPITLHTVTFPEGIVYGSALCAKDQQVATSPKSKKTDDVTNDVVLLDACYGRRIENHLVYYWSYILNNPSLHRIHHARNSDRLGKNFGSILAIWDYAFGTWEPEIIHLQESIPALPNTETTASSPQKNKVALDDKDDLEDNANNTTPVRKALFGESSEIEEANSSSTNQETEFRQRRQQQKSAVMNTRDDIYYGIVPVIRVTEGAGVWWNNWMPFWHMFQVQTAEYGQSSCLALWAHWTPGPESQCPKLGSRLNPTDKVVLDSERHTPDALASNSLSLLGTTNGDILSAPLLAHGGGAGSPTSPSVVHARGNRQAGSESPSSLSSTRPAGSYQRGTHTATSNEVFSFWARVMYVSLHSALCLAVGIWLLMANWDELTIFDTPLSDTTLTIAVFLAVFYHCESVSKVLETVVIAPSGTTQGGYSASSAAQHWLSWHPCCLVINEVVRNLSLVALLVAYQSTAVPVYLLVHIAILLFASYAVSPVLELHGGKTAKEQHSRAARSFEVTATRL